MRGKGGNPDSGVFQQSVPDYVGQFRNVVFEVSVHHQGPAVEHQSTLLVLVHLLVFAHRRLKSVEVHDGLLGRVINHVGRVSGDEDRNFR